MATRSVGVFGGTFDPPHLGHLAAAQEAQWELGLERVLFVPSQRNPLKQGQPAAAAQHRLDMIRLAIAGNPGFEVSTADLDRPPPSYTVDLLEQLRRDLGPDCDLVLVVGMDVLHEIHRWRDPHRLLQLARLAVVSRPGHRAVDADDLQARVPAALGRVVMIWTPGVAISSTELRERVAVGRPIRYLVPDAVVDYIARHRLYARSAAP